LPHSALSSTWSWTWWCTGACSATDARRSGLLLTALAFDAVVLVAFTAMKMESDPAIVVYALIGIAAVFGFERWYLSRWVATTKD
jgi:hypothetical protein